MIAVDLGDGMIRYMSPVDLEGPFYHIVDNSHEYTIATEWKLEGRVVHRSVHVTLKEGIGLEALGGSFG